MFTKRGFAKFVKDGIVLTAVSSVANYTYTYLLDEQDPADETFVLGHDTAALMTGTVVWVLTKERTDRMIDSIADWRKNRQVEETPLPA